MKGGLGLKLLEVREMGTTCAETWAPSRSWKRQANRFSPTQIFSRKECTLPSPSSYPRDVQIGVLIHGTVILAPELEAICYNSNGDPVQGHRDLQELIIKTNMPGTESSALPLPPHPRSKTTMLQWKERRIKETRSKYNTRGHRFQQI